MKKYNCVLLFLLVLLKCTFLSAQDFMTNIPARKQTSLNGKWQVIIDPYDVGIKSWKALYKDKKPVEKSEFYEYSFDGGPVFDVPGEINSQLPELKNYESTIWYKKTFVAQKQSGKRLFLYFDAVNYITDVFLNNEKIGSHEGGFTPFQFEITDKIKEGQNSIIVRVNNERQKDGVPATGYDWLNYGGITRDVRLVETPSVYIDDYFIQLEKGSKNLVSGYVKLAGVTSPQQVKVQIPEAKINLVLKTNAEGYAAVKFPAKLSLWSPKNPKLYQLNISCESDVVSEAIGFRSIETKGTDILLNGESVFLKGVNIHEEVPQRKGRAYSESDALMLLTWAKELGCNFIRTSHYPHNENMVRMAERMGFMIWEEVPVFQSISFDKEPTQQLMNLQLKEIVRRDKNRCAIITWSMANETPQGSKNRTQAIANMATLCRSIDNTRLIAAAFNNLKYAGNKVVIEDDLINSLDVIGINEYIGWYKPWFKSPSEIEWVSNYNKPVIMSEFGCEALYENHGPADVASSWSEEYMEQFYKDQITMLKRIPFLRGTCPWILADFQSPLRLHPTFQNGWNRKGLLSDKGEKKKAWFVLKEFYSKENSVQN